MATGAAVGVTVGAGVGCAVEALGEGAAVGEFGLAGPALPLGAAQAATNIRIINVLSDLRPYMTVPPKRTWYVLSIGARGPRAHLPEVTEPSANQPEIAHNRSDTQAGGAGGSGGY